MTRSEEAILVQLAKGPATFTHAIDLHGTHTKLVRSSVPASEQKHLHELALSGLVARTITGCGGKGKPPETTVTYTLTAMGRRALGIYKKQERPKHRDLSLTDEQLLMESEE